MAASEFGNPVDLSTHPKIAFEPVYDGDRILVPLVDIDPIGNLVLGLRNGEAAKLLASPFVSFGLVDDHRRTISRCGSKFSDVPSKNLIAYRGSNGLLELAINDGNLAGVLNLSREQGHLELSLYGLEFRPATVFELKAVSEAEARAVA